MIRRERQDTGQTIVRPTKHFITLTSADANNYDTPSFNPGDLRITFNNASMTNVSSAKDATYTTITPISLYGDCYYFNISPNFKNDRIRILSQGGKALSQTIGGVANTRENSLVGDAGYDPATFPEVVIPEGMYNAAELSAAILAALNASTIGWWTGAGATNIVWTNTAIDGNSRLRLAYATNHPTITPDLYFYSQFLSARINQTIDSSSPLGMTFATIAGANVFGAFILPYANRVAGVLTPKVVDLRTVQQVQVHSNVAGRTFAKRGYSTNGGGFSIETNAGLRPLSMTDILFTFNLDVDMGSTFVFEPASYEIFQQQITNNFDEFRIYLTNHKGEVIKFINNAEFSFTFSIEREVISQTAEDRIKDLMNYNAFRN
jgi:hypothetical protein